MVGLEVRFGKMQGKESDTNRNAGAVVAEGEHLTLIMYSPFL